MTSGEMRQYEIVCRHHQEAGVRVGFDQDTGTVSVQCKECGEPLHIFKCRPRGCTCKTPSQMTKAQGGPV